MSLPPPSSQSAALVTGASSGIGTELARSLARRGHGLILTARRDERLRALADELSEAHGVRAEVVPADIGRAEGRDQLAAEVERLGPDIEVLVNCAGYGSGGLFKDLDREREVAMVRLNCEAVVDLCARYLPGMTARGRGAVLNVASTAAFQPLPRQATYSASKAFVLTFNDALTADLHGTGVTATTLCPGPVRTEFADQAGLGEEATGLPSVFWADSDFVAEQAVQGLERGKRVVVPGRLNHLGALSAQHAPRSVLLRALGRLTPVGR